MKEKNMFNIGVALMALILFICCGQPIAAQSSSTWTKINSPGDGISTVTISPENVIFVTRANAVHVSSDLGVTWTRFTIPFASLYIHNALWFNGKLYVSGEDGIICTADGQNWEMSKAGYGFQGMCCNSQFLYIFGVNNNSWKTADGVIWTQISQPASSVNEAAADENVLIAVCDYAPPGQTGSRVYKSYNNGQTWTLAEDLNIQPIGVSTKPGQYDVVGFTMGHQMSSRGQYNYDYSSGYLMAVNYFNGDCLVGGSENLTDPNFYRGIIFTNGDLSTAVYFDGEIIGFTSNANYVVANLLGFDLYILAASTNGLPNQSQKSFNVSVHPNPTDGVICVESPVAQLASLHDISGQLIKEYKLLAGKNNVDLSNFNPGIYFLRSNFKTVKIIKI